VALIASLGLRHPQILSVDVVTFKGGRSVPADSRRLSLADFYAGGGEVNEPLNELGLGSRAAEGVPEAFPGFMSFPVEARVEEVQCIEPPGIVGDESGKGSAPACGIRRQGGELRGGDRRLVG